MKAPLPWEKEHVARYLEEHGAACPSCGYDLHGAGGDHCPECGLRLGLLLVGLRECNAGTEIIGLTGNRMQGQRFEVIGLIGAAAGFGFFSMALITAWYVDGFSTPMDIFDLALCILTGITFSLLALWLLLRERVMMARRTAAAGWAGLAWAVTLGCLFIFLNLL